jgi:hypothetical protein
MRQKRMSTTEKEKCSVRFVVGEFVKRTSFTAATVTFVRSAKVEDRVEITKLNSIRERIEKT